ncbi:MAG: hypothetical protein JO316_00270 [Abitibacteriaceae bacterium]|nr:hypothetical protein [Abditibacteriaceae bacterium]
MNLLALNEDELKQLEMIDLELCLLTKRQQDLLEKISGLNQRHGATANRRTNTDRRSGRDRRDERRATRQPAAGATPEGSPDGAKDAAPQAVRPSRSTNPAGRRASRSERRLALDAHYKSLNKDLAAVVQRGEALAQQREKLLRAGEVSIGDSEQADAAK